MTQVLWLEDNLEVASELPYLLERPEKVKKALEEDSDILVVAVGTTVEASVSVAQRVSSIDSECEVLVVCLDRYFDSLKESLRMTPFIGAHTRAVVADEQLEQKVAEALEIAKKRRDHRGLMKEAQSIIDGSSQPMNRPSPEQFASAMWSRSPVGAVAVLPKQRHLIGVNPTASRIIGRPEIELIGKPLGEVLGIDEDWSWLSELNGQKDLEYIIAHQSMAGEKMHLEIRAVPVSGSGQNIALLFLWDVTERIRFQELQKEYLEAERMARQRAEETSRIRENVLANVAHDLRNPLTTMLTSTQLLEQISAELEESTLPKLADSIRNSARYMSDLVDDLVDVARIEGDRLNLETETVSIDAVVEQAVDVTRSDAENKGIEIVTDQVSSSLSVSGDPTRLVRVVQNLVANAIKFSSEDETVKIEATRRDEMIRLLVIDEGPGIPEEEQQNMFEQFWQEKGDNADGLGLGLAIARGIVEAHGGEISVDSEFGEGTTFCVDLPISGPDEPK